MKTQKFIATVILIICSVTLTLASSPNKVLTMTNASGKILSLPIKAEEASFTVPFDVKNEFHKARLHDVENTIDISSMVKQEGDVNDIGINLTAVFNSIKR